MKVVWKISNIPTPLRRTSKIHHISSIQNASFNPGPVTLHSTRESCPRPVHRRLTYSPSDDDDISADEVPSPYSMSPVQCPTPDHTLNTYIHLEEEEDEEKDFQTIFIG